MGFQLRYDISSIVLSQWWGFFWGCAAYDSFAAIRRRTSARKSAPLRWNVADWLSAPSGEVWAGSGRGRRETVIYACIPVFHMCSLIEPKRESILFTGGRKVSKRKFPISEEHSGATSNSNCSVRIKGHWWKYLSLSSGDGQRKAFNCSHINPYVPSLFFLATGSNKSYIRISQLKLVMKMAHWVRCLLEVFILSFSFHTYLAQDEHACWVGHLS